MSGLEKLWKDKNVLRDTKIRLVKALVFSVALYGSETWVIRARERKKIDAFELWCWRRLLRVSWVAKRSNVWVLDKINPVCTLESLVVTQSLKYFGHTIRKDGNMEKDIMLGRASGTRRRGRPRIRWLDTLITYTGMKITDMARMARDRNVWRKRIHDIARNRTRFDGTR